MQIQTNCLARKREVRLNFLKNTTWAPDCSKNGNSTPANGKSGLLNKQKQKWRLCTCTWRYLENAFIGKPWCTGVPGSGTLVDETRPLGHSDHSLLRKKKNRRKSN